MAIAIMWFRRDLRLSDNPALCAAIAHEKVYPVYIYDQRVEFNGASAVWREKALSSLSCNVGGKLHIFKGKTEDILVDLAAKWGCDAVYANRVYEPKVIEIEKQLQRRLSSRVKLHLYNGNYLSNLELIRKKDGSHYRVFTPFYNYVLKNNTPSPPPLAAPSTRTFASIVAGDEQSLSHNHSVRAWQARISDGWDISEEGAHTALKRFILDSLDKYSVTRDYPNIRTSQLAPYLHFGQISPHQIIGAIEDNAPSDAVAFVRQIVWREFAAYSLIHFPFMAEKNMRVEFDAFNWCNSARSIELWQKGNTGVPIVDAGMRQLWQTGFMHNRVRMIVASFLVKNLMVDWRVGRSFFEETLFDADLANNSAGWQWVVGSGIDSAPYFRIFNPITQSRKFDANGCYIRRFVPEISHLSDKEIHAPWLNSKGIIEGNGYPKPMVDVQESRQRALNEYRRVRQLFKN